MGTILDNSTYVAQPTHKHQYKHHAQSTTAVKVRTQHSPDLVGVASSDISARSSTKGRDENMAQLETRFCEETYLVAL